METFEDEYCLSVGHPKVDSDIEWGSRDNHKQDASHSELFWEDWKDPSRTQRRPDYSSFLQGSSSASSIFHRSSSYPSKSSTTTKARSCGGNAFQWHFRNIQPADRQRIQQLHEEWFPVTYQKEFYDDLVLGKMCHTGEDLYTKVVATPLPSATASTAVAEKPIPNEDSIVACIVAAKLSRSKLNSTSRRLLLPDPSRHTSVCYIMTLGTISAYRQEGLATRLVETCIDELVQSDPRCGALYLHVITLNQKAIRFYENLGFWKVQEIADYYTIDGKNYNCYLYAKYFHGNRGHLDLFQLLSWWISSLLQKLRQPLSYLRGPGRWYG